MRKQCDHHGYQVTISGFPFSIKLLISQMSWCIVGFNRFISFSWFGCSCRRQPSDIKCENTAAARCTWCQVWNPSNIWQAPDVKSKILIAARDLMSNVKSSQLQEASDVKWEILKAARSTWCQMWNSHYLPWCHIFGALDLTSRSLIQCIMFSFKDRGPHCPLLDRE